MMDKKIPIGVAVILLIGFFLGWLFLQSSKPLPGQKMADQGREHVPLSQKVDYNSNPPTSGAHYADWIRAGVYDEPKADGNLVHSLEHGYVIISYNCDKKVTSNKLQVTRTAYAHGLEEEEGATESAGQSTPSATLSESFRSDDCHKLVDALISVYEKKGKRKLIIIPRPNLDAKIALTAWTYLDKFNPSTHSTNAQGRTEQSRSTTSSGLSASDMERIEKFIDTHRDQGPEKTME